MTAFRDTFSTFNAESVAAGSQHLRMLFASRAPFYGGAEQALLRLSRGLIDAGHDVKVVLGHAGEVPAAFEQAEISHQVQPLPNTDKWTMWRYILARRALRRRIVEYAPDILHANDLPTLQILADASRGTGIPLVCHHRFGYDADAIDWFNKYPADLNIFISRKFYQQMTETSPRLARQPHVIIHDGLPLAEPADDSQRRGARLRLRLPPDRTMVTFTGQIIPRKGVAELLHAWSLLPVEMRNSSELLIVGDDLAAGGAYLREMRTLAEELQIKPHFAGFQQPIDPYLLASDLVVLPSLAEPLGLTIMEAMAFGLPTIGSDVGGIPEMIEHEKTGLLVPPGDLRTLAAALERLISDSAMRSELGRAARQRCKAMFSIESHVRAVVDAYRQCMQMDRRRCAA